MDNEKINEQNLGWPSEALLLGGASAVAYAVGYAYEMGFYSHYEIPVEFLRLNISTMIKAVIYLFFYACLAITLHVLIVNFLDSTFDYVRHQLARKRDKDGVQKETSSPPNRDSLGAPLRWLWAAAIPVMVACITLSSFGMKHYLAVIPGMFSFLHCAVNYVWSHLSTPISSKLGAFPLTRLARSVGFLVFSWLSLFLITALLLGAQNAQNREEYLIPDFDSNAIVVRIYGDEALALKVDRKGKCLAREYFLFKLQGRDGKPVSLRKEHFGKLKRCQRP